MADVLIAGCGYVGTALGLLLTRSGHRVWAVARNVSGLPASFARIQGDLANPDYLVGIPADLDAVFYLVSADRRDASSYRRAYVETASRIVSYLETLLDPMTKIFFASSTAVYAQTDGGWVDEHAPTSPVHHFGKILLEAESVFRASVFSEVIVRFAGIYGPARTRLIDRVKTGRVKLTHHRIYTNRIHRDDCAGLLAHLLACRETDRVYLGVDCEVVEKNEVLRWLARNLHVSLEKGAAGAARGDGGSNKRCSNARLLSTGYRFRYPGYRDGYAALLRQADSASCCG